MVDEVDEDRGDVETPDGTILSGQKPRTSLDSDPTDEEKMGQRNVLALEQFYRRHQQWDTFMYPHYTIGMIKVRFFQPLEMPLLLPRGNGLVQSFSVQFEEMF